MKNKTSVKLLSMTVAVALTCSLAACKGFSKSEEEAASSSEAAASSSKTEILTTLTDEELQELISGEVTIDQIAEKRAEEAEQAASSHGEASASSVAGESAASTASDSSASSTETPSASSVASSSASSSASASEAPYEAEIRSLINQLYAVKAKAESGLNSAIASATAEYKALPAEKQTQTRKIAICMGKAGQLKSLESSCDKEVESIVAQMRKVLTENGQPTTLADQAMSSYKAEKSAMYASLTSKLYG